MVRGEGAGALVGMPGRGVAARSCLAEHRQPVPFVFVFFFACLAMSRVRCSCCATLCSDFVVAIQVAVPLDVLPTRAHPDTQLAHPDAQHMCPGHRGPP